jgi:hypothetical protein
MNDVSQSQTPGDRRAAAASDAARRLRDAARTLRRLGGRLRYHPATGQRPQPGAEFLEALSSVDDLVKLVQRGAEERGLYEAALATAGNPGAELVHAGHAAVDLSVQAVVGAVQVLRAAVSASNDASLDAPYGSGAPRRHHPGALSTIVAERVESLALALESVTILKANLARAGRTS